LASIDPLPRRRKLFNTRTQIKCTAIKIAMDGGPTSLGLVHDAELITAVGFMSVVVCIVLPPDRLSEALHA
jgi:hypothetical protein